MASADDRLPQGYTNLTRRVAGEPVVEKIYTGSDARSVWSARHSVSIESRLRSGTGGCRQGRRPLPLRPQWIAARAGTALLDDGSAATSLAQPGAAPTPSGEATRSARAGIAVVGDYCLYTVTIGSQNLLFVRLTNASLRHVGLGRARPDGWIRSRISCGSKGLVQRCTTRATIGSARSSLTSPRRC